MRFSFCAVKTWREHLLAMRKTIKHKTFGIKTRPFVAELRFYEELNDFLPRRKQKVSFAYHFSGHPAIKDVIESQHVPHTEVDLIIVNGCSVSFRYQLQNNDRVSVYPQFEAFDISSVVKLRDAPLRKTAFILDVHLGRLAEIMRLLGFDTVYENKYDDPEIIKRALTESRIILTRDRRLLHNKKVTHGYCIRSHEPMQQIFEVLRRFDLSRSVSPFTRCQHCNGMLRKVRKEEVFHLLEPKTKKYFFEFTQCSVCKRVYWKGSHFNRIEHLVENITQKAVFS